MIYKTTMMAVTSFLVTMMVGGNGPRYHRLHISVSSQAAPLNLTYLPLYISNISPHIAPAIKNTTDPTHLSHIIRLSHEFQGSICFGWISLIKDVFSFHYLVEIFVKSEESCCSNFNAPIRSYNGTAGQDYYEAKRAHFVMLECCRGGRDASVAGDQSSVDVHGDGSDASLWRGIHCCHSRVEFPESATPNLTLPFHCMQPLPVKLNTMLQ